MKMFLGLITPLIAYAVITLLHLLIPAKKVRGYVKSETTGEVLTYRINGKYVLWASIIIWFLLGQFHLVPFTWLYDNRWLCLIGGVIIGLTYSFYMVLNTRPPANRSLRIFGSAESKIRN